MGHFHIHSEVIAEEAVHVSVVLNIFIMFISALQLVKVPIFHLESGFILRTVFSVTVPFCIVLGNMGLNILLLVHFRKYLYLCSGIIIGVLIYFILGNIPAELFFSLIYIYSIRQLNIRFQKLMFYGILLLFLIELFSLINWVIFIPLGVISIFNQVAVVEEQFYYLFSLFSPFFVILFLFGWVQNYGIGPFFCDSGVHKKLKRKRLMDFPKIIKPRHIFLIAIILSIVVPMYPYLSTINPTQKAVSPDMVFRAGVVDAVRTDWTNIFREMGGSRPLYLLVVFILQLLLRLESVSFVMYSTILFIALLIMSMYYFVSRSLDNNDFAILSAFLLSTGVNVVIGIFLYNISNLLALSVVYFSLGSFFPSLQREEIRVGYLSLVLFFLTLFIHPWTFIQYSLVFLLFLFLKWNENRSNIFYRSLGLFYIVGLVIALTAFFILSTGSIQPYLNEFNLSIFIDSFKAVNLVLAGALSNLVPWVLSTYYLSTQGDEGDFIKFMRILVFSTSVMFLFLNPFDKARVLNNLPVGCFAALGVSKVVSETEGRTGLIFILYVMAHSLVYLFRTLYFII